MHRFALLVPLALLSLTAPALAIVRGEVTRDPRMRGSVVRIESSLGELCSGVLIGSDLVLTAAHCVSRRASYWVVADRGSRNRPVRAVATALHPGFVPGTTPETQPGVDLAILKLAQPLSRLAPIDPRQSGRMGAGDAVNLAGYGVVAEGHSATARTLRQAKLVTIGNLKIANNVVVVADRQRLAERTGAGACLGDSGGPVMRGGQLVGIVSWSSGALRQDPRAPTACGGFTAVTPVADNAAWIAERASELSRLPPQDYVPAVRAPTYSGGWAGR